ncbi:GTPase ObgE [Thermospira aquatica]|uniref:GTPase Obg n=1 Tax=Thermospira aquatica TaxID=2828656 RepID=A0AAX3BAJ7_9SPIR|nr:GTPase ObgE [Thermospira aquatica]URA09283.1 GTPase ObgE [Thermospira aquatica]
MLFKDEVEIWVTAGKGGDGSKSFRREKYISKGGPDGGDGGDGGNIVFLVNPHLRTLSHIHNRQKFYAENGENGKRKQMHGRNGEDKVIEVPPGTVVWDVETGNQLADLTEPWNKTIIAHGGRGGRGNVHFKSATNQTPFYAESGKPGESYHLRLELKMIAHIGLVGFPNAGKSTLISRLTNARPKIANYPFTTLEPHVGVMTLDDAYTSVLIADIPGLIEGAHRGKGLGIEFLKHIERTKVLLFVLDVTDEPEKHFNVLREELKAYSEKLYQRPFLIALNKKDLLSEEPSQREQFFSRIAPCFLISALTGEGLKELKIALYQAYQQEEQKEFPDDTSSSQR